MTEKEAIERLYNFKSISILYGNTYAMHIEQLKQLQEDLGTVLQTLKNKDKRIDELEKALVDEDLKHRDKIKQLKDKMIADKMEQFDDYIIYLIESYLKILEE